MSGFEVAGVVLGAFPVAIAAIDGYRRAALKVQAWKEIRLTYVRCSEDLKNEQLAFKRHLRKLVLPLVVDSDCAKSLLADPSGARWKDPDISALLERKLGESHELYLGYVSRMEEALGELSKVLALDSTLIPTQLGQQKSSAPGKSSIRSTFNKDNRDVQAYKVKFLQGQPTRRRLFDELKDCNEKLQKLLDSSEADEGLVKRIQARAIDTSVCKFWKTAAVFFRALAAACRCQCQDEHAAKLLLQHRFVGKDRTSFQVLFTNQPKQNAVMHGSSWEACKTRIEEKANGGFGDASRVLVEKVAAVQLAQGSSSMSSAKTNIKHQSGQTCSDASPMVTLTVPTALPPQIIQPISQLCDSLRPSEPDCRGYLKLPDDDRRYYVYLETRGPAPNSISLEQLLDHGKGPLGLDRNQSFGIALTIASSFLQLLDSPWFPTIGNACAFDKASITFLANPANPRTFLLNQPYIRRPFASLAAQQQQGANHEQHLPMRSLISAPLARLGITLLELCFRAPLEAQSHRKVFGPGDNEMLKQAFDELAAGKWLLEVQREAGRVYADAISWCLMGNRSVPADKWREEMLKEVVRPLQHCLDCLELAAG